MVRGKIHSIESMGLVDGPGIRTVVFMQGCRLRCRYCHNPDTWQPDGKDLTLLTADELVSRLLRFKPYYKDTGGVTFSGGEPLLQKEFLQEALVACHQAGIHTCLDTAGVGVGGYQEILAHTDLVLFDVKHYTEEGYYAVTGQSMEESMRFLKTVLQLEKPLWIRHVVVPGLTDGDAHLQGLLDFISTLKGVLKVELIPYHVLGVHKYKMLGIPYSLEGVAPTPRESLAKWQQRITERMTEQ